MESALLERIEKWARESPSRPMLSFVDDRGNQTASLTTGELHRKMHTLAALLVATPQQHPKGLGVKRGDRVLLVYPPGLEFIVAFLACLRAGVIAVPVYPPDPRTLQKDIHMFVAVATTSKAQLALTTSTYLHVKQIAAIKQKLALFSTSSRALNWPDDLQWRISDDFVDIPNVPLLAESTLPQANDVAFLQFTSGSTSNPKGVVLTHQNLSHNLQSISSALVATRETIVVSWLPQYHDMGLIGAYLGVIFNGGVGVYLSPLSFIKDPMLWLRLIAQYKATHVQAPNFAYALCARKADGVTDSLDLSSVQHMINGAEPIQGAAIDAFYNAFMRFGLRQGVIQPTYGLAEHTVFVCSNGAQRLWVDKLALERNRIFQVVERNHPHSKEMIGCGIPSRENLQIDVRIVDPESQFECAAGSIGEIWITSPSKAVGYYGLEMAEVSEQTFHARMIKPLDENEGQECVSYLRTGDLGVFYNHELFICGRQKDLLILRGRNHYPQDIEATAETGFVELRPGCSAAIAVETAHSDETLVLVAELRDPTIQHKASLCGRIRAAIAKDHGVQVTQIVFVAPRTIPKTTSGKIARTRVHHALVEQKLTVLYTNEDLIPPSDVLEGGLANATIDRVEADNNATQAIANEAPDAVLAFLLHELAQLLGGDATRVEREQPLQEMGMDSMALTQLQGIVAQKYSVQLPDDVLYDEHTTLLTLHATLCGTTNAASPLGNGQQNDPQRHLISDSAAAATGRRSGKKKPKLFCGCIAC